MDIRMALVSAAVVLPVLAGCASGAGPVTPAAVAESAAASIDDDARWTATTEWGATITAEAPADHDHAMVKRAEEYREAADAPDVFYVLVVFDNTQGTKTIDVFEGVQVATDQGEALLVPHISAAGGVFESEINRQLPFTMQDEAFDWYAEFHQHRAVTPGAVEKVLYATTSEVSGITELTVLLDGEGRRVKLEPAS